jgi:adenylate kinase
MKTLKIIALGSPGVGKGTYAVEITSKYGVLHISSGDIFRENIKNETELGLKAKSFIEKGELVSDDVTIEMMKERLSREDAREKGFYLDGFPRTIPQAEALAVDVPVDMVINYKADPEVIIQRLSGRRVCKKCGAIFHVTNLPPAVEGVCDKCGGEIYQRADDNPESIKERLKVYEEKTKPLINYYQEKGLLREVTVNEDFGSHKDEILAKIFKLIEEN